MVSFEIVIALLLVGAVLSLCADRIGVPYPALLALAGAALALVRERRKSGSTRSSRLALFVAPVLLDASARLAREPGPRDSARARSWWVSRSARSPGPRVRRYPAMAWLGLRRSFSAPLCAAGCFGSDDDPAPPAPVHPEPP